MLLEHYCNVCNLQIKRMAKIKIDKSAYSSNLEPILTSHDRYLVAWGGRGSGKTDTFYLKYLISLFEPYNFRLLYVNKEKSNIRDQQYSGFKRTAIRAGLYDHLTFYDGDYRIVHKTNGNALIPKGMDDAEKTKGTDDITAIWWDEINKGSYEDFTSLNELLRTPNCQYLQFACSFNPVSEDHWLRRVFFSLEDSHKANIDRFGGDLFVHHSTYLDNEFIDRDRYYRTLMDSAAGDMNKVRVNIDGDWGIEGNDNPWLYNFDSTKHVGDCVFKPSYPLYLSFDFNIDPFACTIWQMSPEKGGVGSFVHCIDEVVGCVKIEDMCSIIRSRYPKSIIYVTGDRSGQSMELGRNNTLYQSIATGLGISYRNLILNNSNLEHSDSRELMNTVLYHCNFVIDRQCKTLIADCVKARVDVKNKKPSHLLKDRGNFKMDAFDSMRYLFQTFFLEYIQRKYWKVVK